MHRGEIEMRGADIKIELNENLFDPAAGQALAERLRAEIGFRVESDFFPFYSEGAPFIPHVYLALLYTVLPLSDIYANILASMLWDAAKAAFARREIPENAEATFFVRKVNEDGRILKGLMVQIRDPELIKDLIRQVSEDDET